MRTLKKILYAALLFALCLTVCACGQEMPDIGDETPDQLLEKAYACAYPEDGSEADTEAALLYFTAAAEKGSAEAANLLGDAYRWGEMAEQNDELAFRWYEKAAELGDMYAMNNLGDMLENCESVETDMERASELYIRAAEKGCEYAFANAGRMYAEGIGVEQNYEKAAEFYEKAMEHDPDDIWTNAEYARLYMDGNGVEQDPEKAAAMGEKALNGGNTWASYLIAELSGKGVTFSADTVNRTAECFAELGDSECLGWLGDMYCFGDGPEPDAKKALSAYERILFSKELQEGYEYLDNLIYNCRHLYANGEDTEENLRGAILCECAAYGVDISSGTVADEDYLASMSNIAYDYLYGADDVIQNVKKGIALYEKAGSMGHGHAFYNLGSICKGSDFAETDMEKALSYYEKGAALGDDASIEAAGAMHIKGEGCEADMNAAFRLVTEGYGCTEAEAYNHIGTWYYNGAYLKSDLKKALEMFSISADAGCTAAMKNLILMYTNGEGTKKDAKKAFYYADMAAKSGSEDCFVYTSLGDMHYKGLGTEVNIAKAVECYEKAAADDPDYSNFMLGDIYFYGPEDINDREKAREYYLRALAELNTDEDVNTDGGFYSAMGRQYKTKDAFFYDENKGGEFYDLAMGVYLPAAEAGDGEAIYELIQIMYRANGRHTAEQIKWLEKGVELGNINCMVYLAGAYNDPRKQAELYQKAYDLGNRDSGLMTGLPLIYIYQLREPEKGIALYEEAEDYFSLGRLYEDGAYGVEKDPEKAIEYFEKTLDMRTGAYGCRHIGHVYYSMKNYEKAAEYYERYLNEFNADDGYIDEVTPKLAICYDRM